MTHKPGGDRVVEYVYEEQQFPEGFIYIRGRASREYSQKEVLRRLREAPRVYKSASLPWHGGPQCWSKHGIIPARGIMQTIDSSFEELSPGGKSQKHGHQLPALLYVLEGRGYDISDGERVDWEEGDVALVAAGTVHQHFNADPDRPARVLIIKSKSLYSFANLVFQDTLELRPKFALPGWEDFVPKP